MGASCLPITWLPLVLALWLPISFSVTYILAVSEDHVYPWWPSISATGTLPPESCWFGLFINIFTFLLTLAGYIRHVQLKEFSKCRPNCGPGHGTNLLASFSGLVSVIGCFIIANWQMTNAHIIHYFGVSCCFYGANIYILFQAVFSFWMIPEMNSFLVFVLRTILCFIILCLNISCEVSHSTSSRIFNGKNVTDTLKWQPSQSGWRWYIAYTVMEWCLILCLALVILTFLPDFRKIRLQEASLKMKSRWISED